MTSTTSQPVSPAVVSRAPARRVWRGAVIAAATATIAVELYAAAARALGVPMKAGFLGAATASPLTASSFATGVIVCTSWGAVLATILARKAAQPARRIPEQPKRGVPRLGSLPHEGAATCLRKRTTPGRSSARPRFTGALSSWSVRAGERTH